MVRLTYVSFTNAAQGPATDLADQPFRWDVFEASVLLLPRTPASPACTMDEQMRSHTA